MTNLYELHESLNALQHMLEDAEGSEKEAIETTILGMAGEVGDVVDQSVKMVKNIEGDIAAIDAEVARLNTRKNQRKSQIESVRASIKSIMESAGQKRVKTPLFNVTLAEGRHSVQVVDESLIPDDYVNVKTVIQPDKKVIGEMFKSGETVPGCEYVRGESSVRIK